MQLRSQSEVYEKANSKIIQGHLVILVRLVETQHGEVLCTAKSTTPHPQLTQ